MSNSLLDAYSKTEEQTSLLDKTGEFVQYGLADSVISAGVSFVNTGVALGNAFGGEGEYVDTEEAITNALGDDYGEYYANNTDLVEGVGLAVGSLLPGTAAIKAGRLMAKGIVGTKTTKLATGIREVLYPDKRLLAHRAQIENLNVVDMTAGIRRKLISQNLGQQAAEAAVYEAATLLTMNQNSTLSRGELGYFDAIGENIDTALFGMALGTGIGGTIGYFTDAGRLKNFISSQQREVLNKSATTFSGGTNAIVGDRVALTSIDLAQNRARLSEINAMDDLDKIANSAEASALTNGIAKAENDILTDLNKASVGNTLGNELVEAFKLNDISADQMMTTLAGVKKLRVLKDKEVTKGVTAAVAPESAIEQFPLLTKSYPELVIDEAAGVARIRDDLLGNKLTPDKAGDVFLEAAGMLEAQDIKALWKNATVYVARKDLQGRTVKVPKLKKGEVVGTKILRDPLKIQDTLHDLAMKYDNVYKTNYTTLQVVQKQLDAGPSPHPTLVESYGKLLDITLDQGSPNRLFTSAYKIFNQAELSPELMKDIVGKDAGFETLYSWMNNNKALKFKYGSRDSFLNIHSGELVNDTPTTWVSDLGKVDVKSNNILAGNKVYDVKPLIASEMSTAEATANYAWAVSDKGAGAGLIDKVGHLQKKYRDGGIGSDDIPKLQALSKYYSFDKGPLKLATPTEDFITISSAGELHAQILKEKKTLILRLSSIGKANKDQAKYLSEVAAYADVSEAYVNTIQAGKSTAGLKAGDEFFTADKLHRITDQGEEFRPNTIAIEYDATTFGVDKVRADSQIDILHRLQQVEQTNQNYVNDILGTDSELFTNATLSQNGAVNIAHDITTQQGTTGFVKTSNADYLSGASFTQSNGAALAKKMRKDTEAINTRMQASVVAVNADKEAWHELSILEHSTLRAGKFKFFGDLTSKLDPTTLGVYDQFGVDVLGLINDKALKASGIDNPAGAILEDELLARVTESVNKLAVPKEDVKKIAGIWEQASTNPEAGQAALAQMQQEYKAKAEGILAEITDALAVEATGAGSKKIYQIQNKATINFLQEYQATNSEYLVTPYGKLKAAASEASTLDDQVIYPGRFDSAKFKHMAFVTLKNEATDPWTAKGSGMLTAHSAEALQQKVNHFRNTYPTDAQVITKQQQDEWLKARSKYDAELAISDNQIDSSLRKDGKLWDVAPEPNPDVASEMVGSLLGQRNNVLRQTVKLKYSAEIKTLEQLDSAYFPYADIKGKAELSTFKKHINQLLNLTDKQSHNWWYNAQEIADQAISRGAAALRGGWVQAKTSDDWESFSNLMDNYGLPKVYQGPEDWILANASAPKPTMQKLISKSNGVFSTLMLRLDTAQAIVNGMSTPIMLVPEMQALTKAFTNLSKEDMGRLNLVTQAPFNELGQTMPGNGKLILQATNNLFQKDGKYLAEYRKHGIVGNDVAELRQMVSDTSFVPGAGKWAKGVNKVVDTLATPVDFSETSVKFIAADSARQILDIMKVPTDHPLYWSTIKTFVSRTHGNYNASQRPTLFQGWAGQAVGLFQTYQFNLFQQFMKHIEDGNGAAKYMAGLQAATFGTQSLPGFQAMNQHIGERTNGEKDFYTLATKTFDNPVAEFLLYGGGSSLTRPLLGGKGIDFYSRGDLTPRTPILIPTSFSEVPAISFYSKLYGTLAGTLDSLAKGGNAGQTFLNAVATNGVNRPIAGAAQLWQRYRTTNQGNLMFSYNEIDYAMMIAKGMGAKTLDEGIATQAYYRSQGYKAHQLGELQDLGKAVKTQMRADGGLQGNEVQDIMRRYSELGGKAGTFNRWMKNNYTNASSSNINRMRENVGNAQGRYLQQVMGARLDEFDDLKF